MLSNLRFQERLVLITILWGKRVGSGNIEVVKEVGDMKHNGMASLLQSVQPYFSEQVDLPL